ncbi:MAG: DUF4118 domain-containing protein [Oscillospiraceae bacterium]|nr:DUF4118 domain-containing protein [Oscillospiraceae bacterium]
MDSKLNILACISSSPSSRRVIRAASKLAGAANTEATAIYVESSTLSNIAEIQLKNNIEYAKQNGFEICDVKGSDIALTIAEFARSRDITDLFIGYTPKAAFSSKRSISDRLISYLPNTDIHIVPDENSSSSSGTSSPEQRVGSALRDFSITVGVMAIATVLSFLLDSSRYSNSNIVTIYILAVLVISTFTSRRIYGIAASLIYIILLNYLFIDPRFTLLVYDVEYIFTYAVSFIAALMTGSLASKLKSIAQDSSDNAYRAKMLLETSNRLKESTGETDMIRIICLDLVSLFGRNVCYYKTDPELSSPLIFVADDDSDPGTNLNDEIEAVIWVMEHKLEAGASTDHYASCRYRYLSVHSQKQQYGIIGIDMSGIKRTDFEDTIILSMIDQLTMALDKERSDQDKYSAEAKAENERMRAGLLRSISHDLRTPLTSIYGNATNLAMGSSQLTAEEISAIGADIAEDSAWLSSQMENILTMTKIENDSNIIMSVENMAEIIDESVRHVKPHDGHSITVEPIRDMCLCEVNPKLITQVLVNLLDNALKYTPAGSHINISCRKTDDLVTVSVSDDGNGIPDEDKIHIFERFYTVNHKLLKDSYRSMGLGLNLCYLIINAHGGTIEVHDNVPKGTVFSFSLRSVEVI